MDLSNCLGQDQLTLGSRDDELNIVFPDVVQMVEASRDPIRTNTLFDVSAVDLLADPTDSSAMATKKYTDYTLRESWSIDNGQY